MKKPVIRGGIKDRSMQFSYSPDQGFFGKVTVAKTLIVVSGS